MMEKPFVAIVNIATPVGIERTSTLLLSGSETIAAIMRWAEVASTHCVCGDVRIAKISDTMS